MTDKAGHPSPQRRTLAWALQQFGELKAACPSIPVYLRQYSFSPSDVCSTPGVVPEPSDGIVALCMDSTAAKKMKPIKSIEREDCYFRSKGSTGDVG